MKSCFIFFQDNAANISPRETTRVRPQAYIGYLTLSSGHDKNREAEPRDFCHVREKVLGIEYVPRLYCSRDAFKVNALISTVGYICYRQSVVLSRSVVWLE